MLAIWPPAKARTALRVTGKRYCRTWPIVFLALALAGCALPNWNDIKTLGGLLSSKPNPHDLTQVSSANYVAPTPAAQVSAQPIQLSDTIADALPLDLSAQQQSLLAMLRRDKLHPLDANSLAVLGKDAGYPTVTALLPGAKTDTPNADARDDDRAFASAQAAWNETDFALAYATLRSGVSSDVLTNALRRRAMSNVIQQAQLLYWRAAASNELDAILAKTTKNIENALGEVKKQKVRSARPDRAMVELERRLLGDLLAVSREKSQLQNFRGQLAGLANLPADGLKLARTDIDQLHAPTIDLGRPEIYRLAWEAQPELHDVLNSMPAVTPLPAPISYGRQSAVNLLRLYQPNVPATSGNGGTAQRDAMKNVFAARIELALYQYNIALQIFQKALFQQEVDNAVGTPALPSDAGDLARQVATLDTAVASAADKLRIYTSYADLRAAYARLQDTTGLTALPADFPVGDTVAVTQQFALHERDASQSLAHLAAALGRLAPAAPKNLATANTSYIDLGTYLDAADARARWDSLYASYSDVLKEVEPQIRAAEAPKSGAQLLARAPLGSNVCEALVTHGEYCLPYLARSAMPAPIPAPRAMAPAPLVAPTALQPPAPVAATRTSQEVVQLGAFRSEASAGQAWRELQRRYPSQLAGRAPRFEAVNSGEGSLIRLRTVVANGGALCASLRAAGNPCLVVSNERIASAATNTPAPLVRRSRAAPVAAPPRPAPARARAPAVAVQGPNGSMRLVQPSNLCAAFAARNIPCQVSPP